MKATAKLKNLPNWAGELGRVTLLTGPNRSGKTAIQEAIRLALTNTCSVGATPAKQSLLASGDAYAKMDDGEVTGEWSLIKGKRTHKLTFEEWEVKSVTGDAPITVEEYWALTGEQRWAMVESVVGAFTEPAPDAKDASRAMLKAIKAQVPPAEYQGQSMPELQKQIAHQESVIQGAINAKKMEAERDHGIAGCETNIRNCNNLNEVLVKERDRLQKAYDERVWDQVLDIIREWMNSPSSKLAGCKTIKEAADKLLAMIEDKCLAIMDALGESHSLVPFVELLAQSEWIRTRLPDDLDTYLIDSGEDYAARIVAKASEYGFQAGEIQTQEQAIRLVHYTLKAENIKVNLDRCIESIVKVEANVKQLQERLDQLKAQGIPTYGDAETAAKELASLKESLAKAKAHKDWLDGAAKRAEQVEKLEAEVTSADKAIAEYSQRRADYLNQAAKLVSDKANEVLTDMGFPQVSIEIDTTGKRNKLTAVSEGVDIQAMAGSEKLLYGVALVHAFHELGKSKFPLLSVEAAELSGENLLLLLTSLCKHRTKGLVVVSHWFGVDVEGVVTHKF